MASRIFLGGWGFDGAAEIACLCLIAGVYFHIVSRRFPAVPDPATTLERAGERASAGRGDQAIALLTEEIRLSPQLWQAFQYRGELYLQQGDQVEAAVQRLFGSHPPGTRRSRTCTGCARRVYSLLGDESSSRSDYARADELAGDPSPQQAVLGCGFRGPVYASR